MNYLTLKKDIQEISSKMFQEICIDMDRFENKKYNYLFALVNEVYKGIELCCLAIDIQAYAQIGTLLRQLFEQVSTVKILCKSEQNIASYASFAKAKQSYVENKGDDTELKALYNSSKIAKPKKIKFLDYYSLGWLENIGIETISYDKLLELAEIPDMTNWRAFCNNFVHTNITYMQFSKEGMINTNKEFIYILAALLDIVSCSYNNLTGFSFVFNGIDFYSIFRNDYAEITKIRKLNS